MGSNNQQNKKLSINNSSIGKKRQRMASQERNIEAEWDLSGAVNNNNKVVKSTHPTSVKGNSIKGGTGYSRGEVNLLDNKFSISDIGSKTAQCSSSIVKNKSNGPGQKGSTSQRRQE